MTRIPIEYVLCQYQSSTVSLAVKSHRTEAGGNPELVVTQGANSTTFRLENLDDGGAEIVHGTPRQNHIDFYVLQDGKEAFVAALPAPVGAYDGSLRLDPRDATGTERAGGKRLQDPVPICRFQLISSLIHGGTRDLFTAIGDDPQLHLDYEWGPARIYGVETPEIHFGFGADPWNEQANVDNSDWCEIEMSNDVYATLHYELVNLR